MILGITILILTGIGAGSVISAAVASLITASGVATKIIGQSHTARHIGLYETIIICGMFFSNLFWVFETDLPRWSDFNIVLLTVCGLCMGIFVGVLAVSLSEALNATAIFARRAKLKFGLNFIVLTIAVSKVIGGLLQLVGEFV